jgi:hypothetical protein
MRIPLKSEEAGFRQNWKANIDRSVRRNLAGQGYRFKMEQKYLKEKVKS